jgi:vacuolar iron transporter family protein
MTRRRVRVGTQSPPGLPAAVAPAFAHPELLTAHAVARHYVGDLVYGANDGLITTFAVVAGVAGAALSTRVVVILGCANLLADGFSMAASNFLAIRSRGAVEVAERRAVTEPFAARHALATFLAFLIAGAVPLLAFFAGVPEQDRFVTATALTLVTLFAVGAARTAVTQGRWWTNGLEMLGVGALAAAVAYAIGRLLSTVTGVG